MYADLQALISTSGTSLWQATQVLALSAFYFGALALLVKGTEAVNDLKRAKRETSVNLWLFFLDALLFAPLIAVVVGIIRWGLPGSSFELIRPDTWDALPVAVTAVAAVFVGDFISYWRHRLEHTRLLWPSPCHPSQRHRHDLADAQPLSPD